MKSQIITRTDPDGRAVVGVTLTNATDKLAWLYREDFERIAAAYPGDWSLVDARQRRSYVRVRKGGNTIYVARLVMEAPPGSSVRYVDDDKLNLRRTNLTIGGDVVVRPRGGLSRFKIEGSARV